MRKIKIIGAGLSGLTAAINLAKAGYNVEVFEKNPDCGMRFHGDMQGLENWTETDDVLDSLVDMHLDLNFEATAFRKVIFSNCVVSEDFTFDKPLFYLVKRGHLEDSLDMGLKKQALDCGVKIHFNETIDELNADIVGTGPRFKHINIADKGITFRTNLPNIAVGIINEQAAYKGYSYLLIVNGYACLCSCVFDDINRLNECFEFTKDYFIKKYRLKIQSPQTVGGVGYFSINNTYKIGKTSFVGESAGIQDFFAGFGMRTAIISGYLAAKAIIENLDYAKLADERFKKHLEAGIVNRFAWENVKVDNYIATLKNLNKLIRSTDLLCSLYNFNLIDHFEYPHALSYIRKKYPEIMD